MKRTPEESRYRPGPGGLLVPLCRLRPQASPACLSGLLLGGGHWTGTPCSAALGPGRPVADGCACPVPAVKLLDSDQELYRNFPLTISERWQQEVAETVFDTINAETDRLEARKKTKNKQLGHEEGEGRRLLWAPAAGLRDEKQARGSGPQAESSQARIGPRARRLAEPPLALSHQTTPWARTASCTAICPRWATPS